MRRLRRPYSQPRLSVMRWLCLGYLPWPSSPGTADSLNLIETDSIISFKQPVIHYEKNSTLHPCYCLMKTAKCFINSVCMQEVVYEQHTFLIWMKFLKNNLKWLYCGCVWIQSKQSLSLKAAHLEHCGRLQQKYQHDAELLDDIRFVHTLKSNSNICWYSVG